MPSLGSLTQRILRGIARRTQAAMGLPVGLGRLGERVVCVERQVQLLLCSEWRRIVVEGSPLPQLAEVEFRSSSQNGEDGILLFLFSIVGTTSRAAVEVCASDGIECNTANLILNHGWRALLVDGNARKVARGRRFYATRPETSLSPPAFVEAWVTAENVNGLLESNGFSGEIDLLSLDVDGMDYWIWKSISAISPRVVVLEFNNLWGPDDAVTVPYDPHFVARPSPEGIDYDGASLAAFVRLGRQKGYRLVGCQRLAFNAFFVRDDVGSELLPEVSADTCLRAPFAVYSRQHRLPRVQNLPWQRV